MPRLWNDTIEAHRGNSRLNGSWPHLDRDSQESMTTVSRVRSHRHKRPRRHLIRLRHLAKINAATAMCGALISVAAYVDVAEPELRSRPQPALVQEVATDAAEEQGRAKPPRATSASTPSVVPDKGSQKFRIASGTSPRTGLAGELVRYRVEVEVELPFDVDEFARDVDRTLGDRRSWTKTGHYSFERNEIGPLRIVLATPQTTDRLCAPLETRGEVSCRNGNIVAVNALRWSRGARSYGNDIKGYRTYVINHEVGHSLGLPHVSCPGPAAQAPVMLQQTLGLGGCEANPWP